MRAHSAAMTTQTRSDDGHPSELKKLSDRQLLAATSMYRGLERSGASEVAPIVLAHECEMSRRFGGDTTVGAPLEPSGRAQARRRRFWQP